MMITIAFITLKEAVRKKLLLAVGILTLVYLGLYYALVYHYARDIGHNLGTMNMIDVTRIVTQTVAIVGFYFSNMLVAFLTVMASFGAISTEIENGTVHAILSKPLRRRDYLLGKYLGLAMLTTAYATLLYLGVLGIGRLCQLPLLNTLSIINILKGLLFFIWQPLVILALTLMGSSIYKTLANGIVVISLYLMGLIGGMMEQIGAMVNQTVYLLGIFSSLLAPFDVIYRLMLNQVFADLGTGAPFFAGLNASSTIPSKWMVLYILLYMFGLLLYACHKFSRRDLA
jgi:ABC-type transport system involved in multi-copper enzyme maturation permease subunit